MLPRPWHDSHPTFLALSPGAFSRVCVAVLKSRAMGSWHCEQVSEPTNSAPGMFGGAITVRLTVAQEMAATVAVTTPQTTSSFRRLSLPFFEAPSCTGGSIDGSLIGVRRVWERRLTNSLDTAAFLSAQAVPGGVCPSLSSWSDKSG